MNSDKLRGRITEIYKHQKYFAEALGITDSSLSNKLANKRNMKRDEIEKWCDLLKIPKDKISDYFFAE